MNSQSRHDRTGGYIAIYRKLLDHPLTTQLPAPWFRLFVVILLRANWRTQTWWDGHQNISIPAGSMITSVQKLCGMSGATVRQTRGLLKYLEATNTATITTTSRYTLITLVNWTAYQASSEVDDEPEDEPSGRPLTRQHRADASKGATIEEIRTRWKKDGSEQHHRGRGGYDDAARAFEAGVLALLQARRSVAITRLSPQDRKLCRKLRAGGVTLATIEKAIHLGALRKLTSELNRNGAITEPIRSLHYFVALLSEVKTMPDGYFDDYIAKKLRHMEARLREAPQAS